MSSEWQTVRVEDLAAPNDYALATGPFGSSISARYFRPSGVPVIRGSNLSQNPGIRLDDTGLVFIDDDRAANFARSTVRAGDLIFTCWGTINQVGLIDKAAKYERYVISNKQMKLTPDSRRASAEYLYYFFSSPHTQAQILANNIGSSVPGFNLGQLRSMEVLLPPLPEQQAIAEVLGALDDKIALNRRMNRTLEGMAAALFRSWFVDFDPVVAKADGRAPFGMDAETAALFPDAFVDSDEGPIPEGWQIRRVGEVVEVQGGSTPRTREPAYWDGGQISWCTPKDLSGVTVPVVLETGRKITSAGLAKISSGLLPTKTVLLSSRAPIGYTAIAEVPLAINQGFIAMTPNEAVDEHYLLHWTRTNLDEIKVRAGGTTFAEISKRAFRPIPFLLPARPVVAAFHEQAVQWHSLLVSGARQSRTLAALRDALLPQLLSGTIRLKDAEKLVGEA